jgi:hypothetical protein
MVNMVKLLMIIQYISVSEKSNGQFLGLIMMSH